MTPRPRPYVIAGNWKLNGTLAEARALAGAIRAGYASIEGIEVMVAPPFTALGAAASALLGSPVKLGAQHCHWQAKGAFTGEVSPELLADAGVSRVIIGHSERRQYFGETDATVNQRLHAVYRAGLVPVVCIGETLAEREAGETLEVVLGQLRGGLDGLPVEKNLQVAYEPVWAIGTGQTATGEQAQEVHAAIRAELTHLFGAEKAAKTPLLYGGSVKPDNAAELLSFADIDGCLVGGASLKADSFLAIVHAAASAG